MAKNHGIDIAFEYHRGTLTDTSESAVSLIEKINRGNVKTYWQPNPSIPHEDNKRELKEILPYLSNVHVFFWDGGNNRLPLEDGINDWREYFDIIKAANNDCAFILEFVKNDDSAQFIKDAKTLLSFSEV